jgi:hypothetical protein
MRRFLTALLFSSVSAVAVALVGACDDGGGDHDRGSYGDPCNQVTSCGACTPIQGCGWCTFADGTGACASDPNECASVTGVNTFTWAWEPSGCRAGADASVATGDGGATETGAVTTPAGDSGGDDAAADTGHLP